MPILAPFPVVATPNDVPDFFKDSRTFSFQSIDGSTIFACTGDEFIAQWGMQGLDMPDRDAVEEAIPGLDGTNLVDIKVGSRQYSIPLFLGSNSGHRAYLEKRASFRQLFNHRTVDYAANGGTFDLVASSVMGTRKLRSTYLSGMSGQWSQDASGSWWESVGLTFLAVRPYWVGDAWQTPEIRQPTPQKWFGTFPGSLTSSRAFGSAVTVTVPGEAESWAKLTATGPSDSVTVTGPNLMISIPDGLADGETAVIDTDPRSRQVTIGGENGWARVGPSSVWSALMPGDQQMVITMENVTSASVAIVSGVSQWEGPW